MVLLDCLGELRLPTLMELLWLMDTYNPAVGQKYVDLQEEFMELGIEDIVDLNSLLVVLIATFGGLSQVLACNLLWYCQDYLLYPLSFVEAMSGNDATEDVPLSEWLRALWDLEDQLITEEGMDMISRWLRDDGHEEINDEYEEINDEGTLIDGRLDNGPLDDGDRETSHEV